MDVETLVFLAVGLLGAIAAGAHLYGWIPPRYKTQLSAIQSGTAKAIGDELRAVFQEQEAKMTAAMAEAEGQAEGQVKSQLLNAAKNFKYDAKAVDSAMTQAILGPALPILKAFAPGLAETLEEHPEYAGMIIEHPLFKKYVAPRIEQLLGQAQGLEEGGGGGGGWR